MINVKRYFIKIIYHENTVFAISGFYANSLHQCEIIRC